MSNLTVELETVMGMVRGLSPLEKVRLVEEVMTLLEEELIDRTPTPKRSLYGTLPNADISAEDIAEAREEMWGNFPRRDI